MNKQDLLKALIISINQDIKGYTKLRTLLLMQQKLIMRHNSSELIDLNEDLQCLITKLNHNAKLRIKFLTQLGISSPVKAIAQICQMLPKSIAQKLEVTWLDLEKLAKEGKAINDANGNLIALQKEAIDSLINDNEFDYGNLCVGG